ncbi:hypothetical protein NIES2104_54770 [Leptolyngbya sp. NIES-2104]|nr:hypothetical protein NIES2104_54770 [Leptolyngbya sp. NIES-2104]
MKALKETPTSSTDFDDISKIGDIPSFAAASCKAAIDFWA